MKLYNLNCTFSYNLLMPYCWLGLEADLCTFFFFFKKIIRFYTNRIVRIPVKSPPRKIVKLSHEIGLGERIAKWPHTQLRRKQHTFMAIHNYFMF